jgi:hypothetical protein
MRNFGKDALLSHHKKKVNARASDADLPALPPDTPAVPLSPEESDP